MGRIFMIAKGFRGWCGQVFALLSWARRAERAGPGRAELGW
ncbi:MAG TPA: hypothetical protein VN767_24435 [Streptosporangiaceae bacterium]|nr:hypothetical protein [Streptosporangiaceae bacterium]